MLICQTLVSPNFCRLWNIGCLLYEFEAYVRSSSNEIAICMHSLPLCITEKIVILSTGIHVLYIMIHLA